MKKILYIVTAVICVVPAMLINSPLAYIPITALIIASVLSLSYILILKMSLAFMLEIEQGQKQRSKPFEIILNLTNRSFLPVPRAEIKITATSSEGFTFDVAYACETLGACEKKQLNIEAAIDHIGDYSVKIDYVVLYDFFGFFSMKVYPRHTAELFIAPKIHAIGGYRLPVNRGVVEQAAFSASKMFSGEYSDIREYEQGDSMKNIHWKLSAHKGDYMTRITETPAVNGVTCYFDITASPLSEAENTAAAYDSAVESAYSLGYYSLLQNNVVEIVSGSGDINIDNFSKADDFIQSLRHLPKLCSVDALSTEECMLRHSVNALSLDNIFVFTNRLSESLVEACFTLKRSRKHVNMVCVNEAESAQAGLVEKLTAGRVKCFCINDAQQFVSQLG